MTKISRRALLAGIATAPFVRGAGAQSAAWPTRPVQVMVPYPPAGGADTTARILYAKVGAMLGQQFVIENRGGAGGTIGEAMVAIVLASAMLEKFGGDSLPETKRNFDGYIDQVRKF